MKTFEHDYKDLIKRVLTDGEHNATRNAPTVSTFGEVLRITELRRERFPLITARKMYPYGIVGEMAAFLHAPNHIDDFVSRGCNYWNNWADSDGNINIDYGNAWTNWNGINQIKQVVDKLKTDPKDRRMIITGWDPGALDELSLPCCHLLYQFHVDKSGHLNMMWYQRSADVMVGVPSDIVLGALFIILMANAANLKPGTLTMVFGDTHIYDDHAKQAWHYLEAPCAKPPWWSCDADIFNFESNDFAINDYTYGPKMEFKLHG